jgi:luciferase-type oxidoreductase
LNEEATMRDFSEHSGYRRLFSGRGLSLGLFFAIEAYAGDTPRMLDDEQRALARRAEALGFSALWVRDVPLRDPSFGDLGQIYDPWVYLGYITAQTREIALVTGAIVLPLRHPLHVAKAAASLDALSRGRFVLGLATGDRGAEAQAFGVAPEQRAELFRDGVGRLRRAFGESFPELGAPRAPVRGLDTVPKPHLGDLPLLAVGRSQQSFEFIARECDGFVTYPRPPREQAEVVSRYQAAARDAGRVGHVAQSLYIDLLPSPSAPPRPIHLGWALGSEALVALLKNYESYGVEHVVFNLKYGQRPAAEVLEELGARVLPHFVRYPSDL